MKNIKTGIRRIALLCIASCAAHLTEAQSAMPSINNVIPAAPNAAALGKYGEIPVGLYTGIPNINVPIYEVQSGSLKMPISISYHAGGMRVEEVASWVGLGWSLNAGGVITRQVRGLADELPGVGYLARYDSLSAYFTGMGLERKLNYFRSVLDKNLDSQQDMFTYNVGGESGKFVFKPDGSTMTIPLTKNKFEYGSFRGEDSSWKLTDVNGTTYYFTARETNTAVPIVNSTISAGTTDITSWYLTKIIDATGKDSITLTYDLTITHFNTATAQTKYLANYADAPCGTKDNDNSYSQTSVHGRRLRQIDFPNGIVRVNPKSVSRDDYLDDYALDSIVIKNTDSTFYKKYKFYQSYTTGTGSLTTPTEELKRMFLDSMTLFDISSRVSSHAFSYNQETTFPARSSFSQDHWGYFNGASNTFDFVPAMNMRYYLNVGEGAVLHELIQNSDTSFMIVSGANRNVDTALNQLGILRSITYPTGGRTEFEYETNKAVNYPRSADYVTGYDGFSTTTSCSTTFSVNENYAGSGGANASISVNNGGGACASPGGVGCPVVTISGPSGTFNVYDYAASRYLQKGTYSVTVDLSSVFDSDILANFSLDIVWAKSAFSDSFFTYNANVGGLRVKKITNFTSSGTKAAVKKYTYKNIDTLNHSSGELVGFPLYASRTKTNSRTGEDEDYKCDYALISSGSNYPLLTTQGSYVGYKNVQEYLGENGEFGKNEYTYTDVNSYPDFTNNISPFAPAEVLDWKRGQLLRTKNYSYNTGTSTYNIVQEKSSSYLDTFHFAYGGIKVAARERWTYNPGAVVFDTAVFYTSTGWFPPVSDTTRIYDQGDASRYTQSITGYGYGYNQFQPNVISTTNSKGEAVVTNMKYPSDYVSLTGSDAFTAGIKNLQDLNVLSPVIEKYTQVGGDSRVPQATLTSYKSNTPLPDTVFTTELYKASTSFSASSVSGGSITKSSMYSPQVAITKYDANSNISEQLKLKDAKHAYLWDYANVYPIAEATNADSASIAYTSFEADGSGNWSGASGGSVHSGTSPTGSKYFTLTSNTLQKTGLSSGSTYIVSYWSSTGNYYTVSGTVASSKKGMTVDGWTYCEHEVTGASSISITGTGNIDEVRLYPKGALMVTRTYVPLSGVSAECDASNKITYYEYDTLGRLLLIRDKDKNIIKSFDYKLQ